MPRIQIYSQAIAPRTYKLNNLFLQVREETKKSREIMIQRNMRIEPDEHKVKKNAADGACQLLIVRRICIHDRDFDYNKNHI